jgi:hypothetical protein
MDAPVSVADISVIDAEFIDVVADINDATRLSAGAPCGVTGWPCRNANHPARRGVTGRSSCNINDLWLAGARNPGLTPIFRV